jgi:4-hydroxy-3-methylbut-2-en-1-yl diphosphate reductase
MKVTIDPDSGFCFGVNRAIQTAENELDAGNEVYCLGEIVHNQVQMDELKSKGLRVINHSDLPGLKGKRVLIRAHGEPPETFQLAYQLGIDLIDATCPIVTKLQQRIHESGISNERTDIQIVIFGKPNHAEVEGLVGNASRNAIVISRERDVDNIDFSKPVRLFSQTTMDAENYQSVIETIEQRMNDAGNKDLEINKSVCRQVSGRAPALRAFAADHEVVIFVSGKNSANGAYLYGVCKLVNNNSYFISTIEEIDNQWFENVDSVGLTGATSTPGWLIKQVAGYISEL